MTDCFIEAGRASEPQKDIKEIFWNKLQLDQDISHMSSDIEPEIQGAILNHIATLQDSIRLAKEKYTTTAKNLIKLINNQLNEAIAKLDTLEKNSNRLIRNILVSLDNLSEYEDLLKLNKTEIEHGIVHFKFQNINNESIYIEISNLFKEEIGPVPLIFSLEKFNESFSNKLRETLDSNSIDTAQNLLNEWREILYKSEPNNPFKNLNILYQNIKQYTNSDFIKDCKNIDLFLQIEPYINTSLITSQRYDFENLVELAEIYADLGLIYKSKLDFIQAISYLDKFQGIVELIPKETNRRAWALYELGMLSLSKSIKSYDKAISYLTASENLGGLDTYPEGYRNLGKLLSNRAQYNIALIYYNKYLSAQGNKKPRHLANTYRCIGNCNMKIDQPDLDKAKEAYDEAKNLLENTPDVEDEKAELFLDIAQYYEKIEGYGLALDYIFYTKNVYEEKGNRHLISVYYTIGKLYHFKKDWKNAKIYYDKCIENERQLNEDIQKCLYIQANFVYNKLGLILQVS